MLMCKNKCVFCCAKMYILVDMSILVSVDKMSSELFLYDESRSLKHWDSREATNTYRNAVIISL